MKNLFPDLMYDSLETVDFLTLRERGIRAVILDIDNTLVPSHTPEADARAAAFVERLKENELSACVVSNNIYERAKRFADSLSLPFVCDGTKPQARPFLLALEILQVPARQVAVLGDQIFTDVWGGNRMGMCTLLVRPLNGKENGLIKIKRVLERPILWLARRKHA